MMPAFTFTMNVSLDHGSKVAYVNIEGKVGMIHTCNSLSEQVNFLKALRKSFKIVVPAGSDLAEVAGFRTEYKQRRRKSDRQRLVDRVARLICELPWNVSKQYDFEGKELEQWDTARELLKGDSIEDILRLEGRVRERFGSDDPFTVEHLKWEHDCKEQPDAAKLNTRLQELGKSAQVPVAAAS